MNTADNYIKTIVLNVMYNGKYLNQNMGHEVINLFKDDKGRNFLYLNPYGNFSNSPKRAFEAMLMVIPVAKQNMFEVVAMATGLEKATDREGVACLEDEKSFENVYSPVTNFISSLDKDKYTEAKREAYQKVRQQQLAYIEKNKITYGGVPLDKLFGKDDQQAIYITFRAGSIKSPKKKIFITFKEGDIEEDRIKETENCVYVRLDSCKQCKMSQKQYIDIHNNKSDWDLLNDTILKNQDLWEDFSFDSLKDTSELQIKEDSLFDICGITDSEHAYSNAIAYYLQKYPHLFKDLFAIKSKTITVLREYKYIDILIKDGEERIIIENKIHSSINKKKSDKSNESQLSRYWKELTDSEKVNEESVRAFILCPKYMEITIHEDKQKYTLHEEYEILTYDILWESLKDTAEAQSDQTFGIFVESLSKHSMDSIPKARYEEMKDVFLKRIFDYKIKQEQAENPMKE